MTDGFTTSAGGAPGSLRQSSGRDFGIVVIGVSVGGLKALETLLSSLPRDFPVPIAITQHRGLDDAGRLAGTLQRLSSLPICDAEDKQPTEPGHVYLAPPGYHLLVEDGHFALSTEPPVMYARPSIDVLFETAAEVYGPRVIGVILTGANSDGAFGASRVKDEGGTLIVQEPSSAFNPSLPRAALSRVTPDHIVSLEMIPGLLASLVNCRQSDDDVLRG